jgi:hypothetical protein
MKITDCHADAVPDPREVARTYSPPSHTDAWDAVLEYREVIEYAADHPNAGSHAIASHFDIPRGRVRTWTEDGGMPDAVRVLQVAEKRGWLVRDRDSAQGRALAGLVAWIFSGGSISYQTYSPYFVLNRRAIEATRADLAALAEPLSIEFRVNERDANRAIEFVPSEYESQFGRCLAVAGAPVGNKAGEELVVPSWIREGPIGVKRVFTYVYLSNRGVWTSNGTILQIREKQRPTAFHAHLANLFEEVSGRGSVTASEQHVRADTEASAALKGLLQTDLEALLRR